MLRTLKDLLNTLTEATPPTSPEQQAHQLQRASAVLLVAVGRKPLIEDLDLESVGIEIDAKSGRIPGLHWSDADAEDAKSQA